MKKNSTPSNRGEQLVQFRLSDAARINNVVHAYESGRRERKPSTLPRATGGGGGGGIEFVTFVGGWAKGQSHEIRFSPGTATATAINLFATIPPTPCDERNAAVAVNGSGVWQLIAAEEM